MFKKLFEKAITKAIQKSLTPVTSGGTSWLSLVRESSSGAWQRGEELTAETMLTHSAVFACVSLIASDIAKLGVSVHRKTGPVWLPTNSDLEQVLRKPNPYQNRVQFFAQWITSKLLHGNAYVLMKRDGLGEIEQLFILDPTRVRVLVASDGSVFYECRPSDQLANLPPEGITIPAREIIHDRMNCFFHPLIGISPLTAANLAAAQGIEIQRNSAKFFANASSPSGILTAPGALGDDTAKRLKEHWERNYTGENAGRVAVVGDGLKYVPLGISPLDAQLLEQLKWTAESVCMVFHVPAYKVGAGAVPTYSNAEVLNQIYYSDCLQGLIEALEISLDEGLSLPADTRIEFDLSDLMRMDSASLVQTLATAVRGGLMAPNEARVKLNLAPVTGGDSVYLQKQDHSLEALAERDKKEGVTQ